MPESEPTRRRYLTYAGAAGIAGLAGCSGGPGGNGGGGENGTGGQNGTAAGGSGDNLDPLRMSIPSYGYWTIMMRELTKEGILEQNLSEVGYKPQVQWTWSGATLFASGKVDVAHISPLELARLGPERDLNTACVGKICPEFEGMWTTPGSPYDPDEAGSIQAALDNIVENNALVAHGSWAGGNIPPTKIFMDNYGVPFNQNVSEYQITTAGYTAIPRLMAEEGQIDAAVSSPMHGGGQYALNREMKPIAQYIPWFQDNTDFIPPLVNVSTTTEFADNHSEGLRALVETWSEAATNLFEQGASVVNNEDDLAYLGAKTMEGAKYVVRWGLGEDVPYSYAHDSDYPPAVYEDTFLTDDYITNMENFLQTVVGKGLAPSNWQEHVEFRKLD